MTDAQPPLKWETSASTSNPTVSDRLPDEVVTCLQNARFVCGRRHLSVSQRKHWLTSSQLHLATCTSDFPHVSLMNYTYLPPNSRPPHSSSLSSGPLIIMTSNPSSKKTMNLMSNPNVSLLVHDWVSSRPPNVTSRDGRERSPVGGGRASSLANMLMQMNSAAVSSISATMNGEARVLESGTEEEKWCKEQHLMNNTFGDQNESESLLSTSPSQTRTGDGGRGSYIEDQDVRVVIVRIKGGRISDRKSVV